MTAERKSVSNARWSLDGKSIYYLQGGQLYNAAISIVDGKASLSAKKQLSDVKAGIGESSPSVRTRHRFSTPAPFRER